MLKTLIKKQLQMMLTAFYRAGKNKKQKSKAGYLVYAVLMLYVAGVIFFLFYSMMDTLCAPLVNSGLGWLYFSLAGVLSVVLAGIGSVFMTQSMLYEAKDNEFLLSLPIPPSKILFSRMFSLYIQNFLFGGLVFLAAVIVYGKTASPNAASVVFCVLLFFLLPLFSLALTCILAWLTALLTSRMRNKTVFTMVLSLVFLGVYFAVYFRINSYLQMILTNSEAIGKNIKTILYPLYQMGLAAEGEAKAFVIFAAMVLALSGMVYTVLSRSFIRIATAKHSAAKAKYREKALRVGSVDKSLFRKELRRFTGSAVYMLNCGLGSLILVVGAVAAILKQDALLSFGELIPGGKELLPLLGCAAVCLAAAPNTVTAPSVSLEGKNLWILQSLPVDGKKILFAKLKLHMVITAPIAFLCGVVLNILLKPSPVTAVLTLILPCVFIFLCGELGLLLNLKMPKLDWTNEAVTVKQSMSVMISLFANWGIIMLLAGVYYLLPVGSLISNDLFLLICIAVLAVCSAVLWKMLTGWGAKRMLLLQ